MNCTQCDSELNDAAKFCPECGTQIGSSAATTDANSSASNRYNVVFTGNIVNGVTVDDVKKTLVSRLKIRPEQVERLFSAKKPIIKRNVGLEMANKCKKAFESAGALCGVEQIRRTSFESQPRLQRDLSSLGDNEVQALNQSGDLWAQLKMAFNGKPIESLEFRTKVVLCLLFCVFVALFASLGAFTSETAAQNTEKQQQVSLENLQKTKERERKIAGSNFDDGITHHKTLSTLGQSCNVENANGIKVTFFNTNIPQSLGTITPGYVCAIAREMVERGFRVTKRMQEDLVCKTADQLANKFGNGSYSAAIRKISRWDRTDPQVEQGLNFLRICESAEARLNHARESTVTRHLYSIGTFEYRNRRCRGMLFELKGGIGALAGSTVYAIEGLEECADFDSTETQLWHPVHNPTGEHHGDYFTKTLKYDGEVPAVFNFKGQEYGMFSR